MLHILTDDRIVTRPDFIPVAEALLRTLGSRGMLHLRTRVLHGGALLSMAHDLVKAAKAAGSRLIINDRVDIAMAAGADGVQLGQSAMSLPEVRRIAPELLVGVSVHEVEEISLGEGPHGEKADWLLAGHVFPTASHPGVPAHGTAFIADIARRSALPVIAVGGVTPGRTPEVMRAGASGVAVIGGIWDAEEPISAVSDYLSYMEVLATVRLTVNGVQREVPGGTTLSALLQSLELDPRMIVVEHNHVILRDRETFPSFVLNDGDVLELVHFVGGG